MASPATCFPSQALNGKEPMCTFCYASESCLNCGDGSGSHPCSAYCNTSCNTVCVSKQAFCDIGAEVVSSHPDVGSFNFPCSAKDEFIHKSWTAEKWNDLIKRLKRAYDQLGPAPGDGCMYSAVTLPSKSQPGWSGATDAVADPTHDVPHPGNSLVNADKYNEIAKLITRLHATIANVAKDDVIKAKHSKDIDDQYAAATFDPDVCDACNSAGNQNLNDCNCECECECSCSCDCTCDCNCGCPCPAPGS